MRQEVWEASGSAPIVTHPRSFTPSSGSGLSDLLGRAVQCLSPLDQQFSPIIAAIDQLQRHLAVLGQFKRGKSTLINALLSDEVLPAAVVPLTAIPTFIRSGDALKARVQYKDGRPAEVLTTRCMAPSLRRWQSAGKPRKRLQRTLARWNAARRS